MGAANYINNAKTIGQQKQRLSDAVLSFQTLDKAGRAPTTTAEKVRDFRNVSTKLVRDLGARRIDGAYDRVAPYLGA